MDCAGQKWFHEIGPYFSGYIFFKNVFSQVCETTLPRESKN